MIVRTINQSPDSPSRTLPRPANVTFVKRVLILLLLLAPAAQAGMTVVTLTDAARARLDVLSFFIVAYLLLAWAVKALWNSLAKSFAKMPRLTYRRALSLMLLSGLFLYVILTMISGARELLTPGAWEKQGIGYRLRDEGTAGESKQMRKERIERLLEIRWWDWPAEKITQNLGWLTGNEV